MNSRSGGSVLKAEFCGALVPRTRDDVYFVDGRGARGRDCAGICQTTKSVQGREGEEVTEERPNMIARHPNGGDHQSDTGRPT